MSHEPKPSEHAMRAAKVWADAAGGGIIPPPGWLTEAIDQHAIAPAVADRDRRIKELEEALENALKQLKHTQLMATRGYGPAMLAPDVIAFSEQILAKSERSAP